MGICYPRYCFPRERAEGGSFRYGNTTINVSCKILSKCPVIFFVALYDNKSLRYILYVINFFYNYFIRPGDIWSLFNANSSLNINDRGSIKSDQSRELNRQPSVDLNCLLPDPFSRFSSICLISFFLYPACFVKPSAIVLDAHKEALDITIAMRNLSRVKCHNERADMSL